LILDGLLTHTGDDLAILMSHKHGVGASETHRFAWDCFLAAAEEAQRQGLYGAGQDLLVNAPSGNVRGAGPAVAEVEFVRDAASKDRPAEAFLIFAADKCGPGAYNFPLYTVFCDPMHNSGLLPFAIEAIHSRYKPEEQVTAVSATRLHNIAGKYTGKDDPVAIVRTQGIFPAPEEVVEPYLLGHFVTGDCRGSHVMPLMPVAINTPVAGPFCLPLVSCLAFSMDAEGAFTREYVDLFENVAWDATRLKVQQKADEWRRQGFVGSTMASHAELSYTGIVDTLAALEAEFVLRKEEPTKAKPARVHHA